MPTESIKKPALKVVAHLRGGKLLKGFTDSVPNGDVDALLAEDPVSLPPEITLHPPKSEKPVSASIQSLKALFFVRTFEGSKDHKEIKFFHAHPPIEGLWVRVKFDDNEATEGIVHNSLYHLVQPGFFLKPPDPQSNNQVVSVVKKSLTEFRVLSVRETY